MAFLKQWSCQVCLSCPLVTSIPKSIIVSHRPNGYNNTPIPIY
ncbi:hypothetical protein [Moraxella lacunata]